MSPTLIADRYHVLRELGRGGMGVVYQVLHRETGKQYALKVLLAHKTAKTENVERFKRELKLPARIKSEHVVQVSDSGEANEENDAPFYVMELLRGCDLRKLIDTKHVFTAPEIIWILRQLAQGLSRAHELGIIHRDLKPDNVFLHCRDGDSLMVKILDFGIARYAQELLATGEQEKLTATQAMLGTPLYMAPEQAKAAEGRTEIGPCTDVWAVGMIVFELLTGKTYWNADSMMAHLSQLLFAPMVPASRRASGLPSEFDAWFQRACNRDSTQRFQSVNEQVSELASILAARAPDGEQPPALFADVKRLTPPLVDHCGPTMIGQLPAGVVPDDLAVGGAEDPATRLMGQKAPVFSSAEGNVRAEIFSNSQPPRTESAVKLKALVVLGGALLIGLGVLAIVSQKPTSNPRSSRSADGRVVVKDLASPTDLASRADPGLSPQTANLPMAHKPAEINGKHPAKPKAAKPPTPRNEPPKVRRTYIPPSL